MINHIWGIISPFILSYNLISNIKVIKRISLENLTSLYINHNKIKSINPLENKYFPKLKSISISHNLIDFRFQKNIDIIKNFVINKNIQHFDYDYYDFNYSYNPIFFGNY